MSAIYDGTILDHLADFMHYLSTASSFWFSLKLSYDHEFEGGGGSQGCGGGGSLASARHWWRRHNQQSTKGIGSNGIGNGNNDSNKDDEKNKGDGNGGCSLAAAWRQHSRVEAKAWRWWRQWPVDSLAAAWQQHGGGGQHNGGIGT